MADKHTIDLTSICNPESVLGVVSIPIPGDSDYDISIKGAKSQAVPVGFWPRSEEKPGGIRKTRRALVFFEKDAEFVPTMDMTPAPYQENAGETGWSVQAVALEDVRVHSDEVYCHFCMEPGEVRLSYGVREIAFSLCIGNDSGTHRWQYVTAEKMWGGPLVEAWRIGGHIYTRLEEPMTHAKVIADCAEACLPDDTIAASVYLLLFANGTAQVTAHWINGRIYGMVGNQGGVPFVEFRDVELPEGKWDGSHGAVAVGDLSFNFNPAADLVSEEHPGEFRKSESGSAWQPFEDTRITIRHPLVDGQLQDLIINHSDEGLVQGAARSATWMMSAGPGAPEIGRYIAPPEWYAQLCDFAPFPLELKEGVFEELGKVAAEALLRNSVCGKFTSGGIWRYLDCLDAGGSELAMDANECRSLFRRAYRDTDSRFYDLALRNSYFIADIGTDHSRDIIHYHGDNPRWEVYSLIYQRFSGMVFGYLETGDYYLLETAEAVARNYMSHHLQNWPRNGIGRDADPLTGIMLLWDYTGKEEFFEFGRRFAHHVSLVIHDDGSWLSGSGVGPVMGCNALLGSGWNGGHFMSGFTEYAMRDPNVPRQWLEKAGKALRYLYAAIYRDNDGYHPASCGFVGRIHWYLASRLGDEELMAQTHDLMGRVVQWSENPGDGLPIFTGGRGHHQNNYVDNLIFYQATKDSLPGMIEQQQ